jgi:hypothetical protein
VTGHYVETSFENTDSELEGVLARQMFFMFEDVGVRAIAVLTLCPILPGTSTRVRSTLLHFLLVRRLHSAGPQDKFRCTASLRRVRVLVVIYE